MRSDRSLSVIVPAFNEAKRIGGSLDELIGHLSRAPFDWEIRVVDDGSSDATRAIVMKASAADPRVVLQAEPHRGKGGAVRAGMLQARGRLRFLCDADLSMPLAELPKFLARVPDSCDIAIGVREGAQARRVGEPESRHVMGRAFNGLVQVLLLPGLEDTQCGFKLFTAGAADEIFRRASIDGWAFDIETLILARRLGFRVEAVPIEWHYGAESRLRPVRDAVTMTWDILRIRARLWARAYRD